mgnify:CR=1 FL=1
MKRKRLIGFILAILLGLAAALVYGWGFSPAEPRNTSLASLRKDYQADYVLMVAEAYPNVEDTGKAIDLLKQLNSQDPVKAVDQALLTAQSLGYSESDLRTIVNLELRVKQFGGE